MLSRRICKGGTRLCTVSAQRYAGTQSRFDSRDHYQLLGVERKATSEEIKNAFFTMSKKLHPDSDPTNPLLHSQFVRLSEAYKILSRDTSRREYDRLLDAVQRDRLTYGARSSYYSQTSSSAAADDNARYWSQFSVRREEPTQHRQGRNGRFVLYCVLIMAGSLTMHYVGFKTLREIHNEFMEKQHQRILKIYNEAKERARVNGFRKQQDILRQKHAEFTEKYHPKTQHEESKK
ncbi:DnaJ heat shock protein family (Hsp40) member C4 L homeolog [Xenopus laevis]|uniref:DnaJ heat shock protein family (Hsp40) member C4 L homeolog n=1 Tax=Xenopus laevis TaxID=8355 RepID=Q7T0Z2_XENLA|nr:DnaJ heat shock protein family (Hsp40) member C4 L homeolog [Xenopus laevis]AAH55975.1 MGC68846 protein [Xenopus laevis]